MHCVYGSKLTKQATLSSIFTEGQTNVAGFKGGNAGYIVTVWGKTRVTTLQVCLRKLWNTLGMENIALNDISGLAKIQYNVKPIPELPCY